MLSTDGVKKQWFGIPGPTAAALARAFPWGNYRNLLDVGTGDGSLPVHVLTAQPHLTAVGFDEPAVQGEFEQRVAVLGLEHRLYFWQGDLTRDELPGSDVIVMAHLLRGCTLKQWQRLLLSAYDALTDEGALIVIEALSDDHHRASMSGLHHWRSVFSPAMETAAMTAPNCIDQLQNVGYRDVYLQHLTGADSMVVGMR